MRIEKWVLAVLVWPVGVWGLDQDLTTANDSGTGSLRTAINNINTTGDAANNITADATYSIALSSNLPNLKYSTTLVRYPFDISGSLDFTLENGISLTFDQAGDATFSGNILEKTGAASVIKDASNQLTLAGTSKYTGGTTIKNGTLVVTADANLGDKAGPITFDGTATDIRTLNIQISNWEPLRDFTFTESGVLEIDSGTVTITTNFQAGAGSLTKKGSGALVLGGLNGAYTGDIIVSAGTLEGDSFAFFNSDIDVTTQVTFNQTEDGTYASNISNIGNVIKTGKSKLIWTGTHTYTGGTTVSAGTLQGDHNSLQGKITNNAAVIFDESTVDGTYAGVMSGTGSLTKIGAFKLTLTGANTYSGGTTITAGTLEGTTTSIQGNIVNNGALNFNQTTTGGYGGNISGTGSLEKLGTGTVILSGTNSYTGGTTVTAGVLQGTTNSLPGNIINNASLVFSQSFDGTFGGTITGGAGSTLGKEGSGRVTLLGNANADSTTITGGGLFIHSGATLTSPLVTIGTGGELGGGGTVVAASGVGNSGTITPGDGVGTLTITGSYTHESTATLKTLVTPSTASLLSVSGTATLNGGDTTIVPTNAGTQYAATTTYTVLSPGALVGTFGTLTIGSPSPLMSATYDYSASPLVKVVLNVAPFDSVVTGGNPGVVARYLDSLPVPAAGTDLDFVFSQLQLLGIHDLREALNQLQPANYKGLILAQESNGFSMVSALSHRAEEFYKTECSRERACPNQYSLWADTYGDFFSFRGHEYFNGLKSRSWGVLLGGDYAFCHGLFAGLFGGYSFSNLTWNQDVGSADTNSYYGGLYGGWHGGRYFVNASAFGAASNFDATRKMDFLLLHRKAYTSHDGQSAGGHLDGGVLFCYKELEFRPFASLDYMWLHEDGFSESRAKSLNLKVGATDYSMVRTEMGFKLANCWWMDECTQVIPDFKLSWIYEGRFEDENYTASLKESGGSFTVRGLHPDVNMLATGFGVTALFAEGRASLSIRYDGAFGKEYHDNRGQFQFIYRF